MKNKPIFALEDLAEECTCETCTSQDSLLFLTATKEDLAKLPPLSAEEEAELRDVSRRLRERAEEDLEQELLQTPLKNNNVGEK